MMIVLCLIHLTFKVKSCFHSAHKSREVEKAVCNNAPSTVGINATWGCHFHFSGLFKKLPPPPPNHKFPRRSQKGPINYAKEDQVSSCLSVKTKL